MADPAATLEHRFVPGTDDGPVLLALHGTGGSPDDIVPLARALAPEAPVLAPAGPVSEHGAARWFRRLAEGIFDTEDVIARAHQLADFVATGRREYAVEHRPVVAVGFSNGANIAAAVTLLRPETLTGAALFSAMLPVPDPPAYSLGDTRVFLSGGERDPMAPLASTDRLVTLLRDRGAAVEVHRHPGGHQITPEGVDAARAWLASAWLASA